ncbi:hypothetical protein [Cypionkella sp. TWP1-2-1b2]|uniref:hypothetical protein n=1 Tax=Cypionkella sp. TWP1-2-1b2 TaxID=2804675 RepID=UPI003CF357A0
MMTAHGRRPHNQNAAEQHPRNGREDCVFQNASSVKDKCKHLMMVCHTTYYHVVNFLLMPQFFPTSGAVSAPTQPIRESVMSMPQVGTVAQLVYADRQPLNFARLVGDLHSILVQTYGLEVLFEWDCEDIAFLDLSTARIALGWDDRPGKGYSACMTVSVGPLPGISLLAGNDGWEQICSRIVERVHGRFPALATLWHQTEEELTSDLLDSLVAQLPPLMQLFPFQEPDWVADAMTRQSPSRAVALRGAEEIGEPESAIKEPAPIDESNLMQVVEKVADVAVTRDEKVGELIALKFSDKSATARARARAKTRASALTRSEAEIANDRPTLPHPRNLELARLRDALYQADPEELPAPLSTQLRLTVHALNTTLILVWAPLGAAVMTYSLLKGEDMKLSARLMVLTGLFATAIEGAMGQHMAALVGA